MKTTLSTFIFVLSIGAAFAQESAVPANDTVQKLSTSADQQLAASIEELTKLREKIENEKLPLAKDLTASEERLAELRKEYDRVTRQKDAGTLEIPAIKAEMKIRQEELSYIANLLDEYARTFDQRINVGEAQYIGEAIQKAKGATENATLSADEKFDRQLEFVLLSTKRVFDALGGMRFPGVAVDMDGSVADGMYAILGPVALFRSKSGKAGIVVPQTGSTNPLVRPLEGPIQADLGKLVESGEGNMPFDPSRGGALKALVQKTNLIHIFEKGGPIMWPLLGASILALAAVLERVFFLMNEARKRDMKARERVFEEVERGDFDMAVKVGAKSKDYVVRTLVYALDHRDKSLANAILYAQGKELKRFKRGISVLDTVITLSPLLGLLGTVTGMMNSFSLIGGDLSAPGAITGGIAEALIATAFGLGIAIVCLLPFNILNTKLDAATAEIDAASKQLELLLHPQGIQPAQSSHATHVAAGDVRRHAVPALHS